MREPKWSTEKAAEWTPIEASIKEAEAEVEVLRQEVQTFIDRFQPLFQTIAADRSLRYEAGNGFYIDFKRGVVTLDVKDFAKMKEGGLNPWQVLWSVCHEIGHFRDLQEHPEGMLEQFSYLEDRAKNLGSRVLDIWKKKSGGELPPHLTQEVPWGKKEDKKTKPFVEVFLYQKLHLLYNLLDDMYVNQTLTERTPIFETNGDHAGDVVRLYEEHLFPADPATDEVKSTAEKVTTNLPADYRKLPKNYQLAYSLLRKRMVPGSDVVVADDVQDILQSFPSLLAKRLGLTVQKFVDKITTPGANGKEQPERDPAWRYTQIRERIEPLFVDLLFKDIEELELPPPPKIKAGGVLSPWDELNQKPEPIDLDTIKNYIEAKKQKDKEDAKKKEIAQKKANETPEDRAKNAQAAADKSLCQAAEVDPAIAARYRTIEKEVEPYKHELAKVFEKFMQTVQERITTYFLTGFRSGKLDVRRFIRKYAPDLAQDEGASLDFSRLEVYLRKELMSRLMIWPNELCVRLLLDGSGSMSGEKIAMVRRLAVLLQEGLATFEETMNLRFRLKEPFHVDIEIRVFGNDDKLAKPFRKDQPDQQPLIAKFVALEDVQANAGSTNDAPSFKAINASIKPDRVRALQEGKTKELIIYIADGGSDTKDDSKRSIDEISVKGAVVKGLQVGDPSSYEQDIFNEMFGLHGEHIKELKNLPSTMARLLHDEIQKISIQVFAYEDTNLNDEI